MRGLESYSVGDAVFTVALMEMRKGTGVGRRTRKVGTTVVVGVAETMSAIRKSHVTFRVALVNGILQARIRLRFTRTSLSFVRPRFLA